MSSSLVHVIERGCLNGSVEYAETPARRERNRGNAKPAGTDWPVSAWGGFVYRKPEETISHQAHGNAGHGKSDPGTDVARCSESRFFSPNEDDTFPRRRMVV